MFPSGENLVLLQHFLEGLVLTQHLNPQNNQEGAGFGESLGSDFYNIDKWNIEIWNTEIYP